MKTKSFSFHHAGDSFVKKRRKEKELLVSSITNTRLGTLKPIPSCLALASVKASLRVSIHSA